MACKECQDLENHNCGCEDYCECSIKLSTICSLYDGVKLKVIDTYQGENLEGILLKIDLLFADIFKILNGSLYLNIGDGAKVYKRNNSKNQAEFRTILSSESINVIENLEDIGISINQTWLTDFITNLGSADINTFFTNVQTGKRIATYRSENNTLTDINETVTPLVDNGNGTFTYTNELGVPTTINVTTSIVENVTTITNTISGKVIATHTNELGNATDIRETITVLQNVGNQTFTYTNENGVVTTYRPTTSTQTQEGLNAFATELETQAGTINNKTVTPLTLSSRTATELRTGLQANATQAEANSLASTNKTITPATIPKATTTQEGISRFATQSEVAVGTATNVGISPSTLNSRIEAIPGATIAKGDIIFGDFVSTGTARTLTILNNTGIASAFVTESQANDARIIVTGNFGNDLYFPNIVVISQGSNWNIDNDTFYTIKNMTSASFEILLRQINDGGDVQNIRLRTMIQKF
jgi:hypothetical protein